MKTLDAVMHAELSTSAGRLARFRSDRPGYAALLDGVRAQARLPLVEHDDERIDCLCGDAS